MKKQKKPQQLALIPQSPRFFGGQLLHGKRRGQRPLSSREAMHLVIRSSWAKGSNSFLAAKNRRFINQLMWQAAAKYQVKIYRHALVGNHCHLIIKFPHRQNYLNFIRVFTGKLASHVMKYQSFQIFTKAPSEASLKASTSVRQEAGDGSHRGKKEQHQCGKGQRFFNFRPFTRILSWGRDFKVCNNYLQQNMLEALGCIPYQPRSKHRYEVLFNSA